MKLFQVNAYEKYFYSQSRLHFPAEAVLILPKQSVYNWTQTTWSEYFITRNFYLNGTQ